MTLEAYIHRYLFAGDRGGFAAKLGEAWCHADSGNRAKLEAAFPNIFTVPEDLS